MNRSKVLGLLLAALLAPATAIPLHAQTIVAQDNPWVTGNGTQIDFSNFGNVNLTTLIGSAPTNSVVTFQGTPLSSQLGSADTIVQSGEVDVTSGTNSATLTLEALSLTSSANLTTEDGRAFAVTVGLVYAGSGSASFTRVNSDGGTYTSSFAVTPLITFTNVSNSSQVYTVDCSQQANSCSFVLGGGGNWTLSSTSGFNPQSLGIPVVPSGVKVGSYTTVGRAQYGAIYPGVGGTKSSGYSNTLQNEIENAGKAGHGAQPPTDCSASALNTTQSKEKLVMLSRLCLYETVGTATF
jgi:hypothetical protein